ncbi:MAG: hypothetical protein A3B68_05805 [Candidatus Melainabacteria bacterium RIFCSPHIGHO2_02_FULL_34_12]|nr:MAG: hypothetical protein A3B68_05805 [Candidatus Melainabacteria bacterium RIFCSPHIGHO2_02_FULL_34_12]
MSRSIIYLSLIIVTTFCLSLVSKAFALPDNHKHISFAYITDLNLYPTPLVSRREKNILEKNNGLLIYESQVILQDVIRYINQKLNLDAVVFGGNNIAYLPESKTKENQRESIWQLFLEMTSELKPRAIFVPGLNEMKLLNTDEIINSLKSSGIDSDNLWWSHKIKDFLFIGLNSSFILNDSRLCEKQLIWLKKTLVENKTKYTVLFLHDSVLTPDGIPVKNKNVRELLKTIEEHSQIVLVASGGDYLNRIYNRQNTLFISTSSPIAYPCSYKLIEIDYNKIKVKTLTIPFKGIVKKSEQYLIASDYAIMLFPSSPKLIKNYVKGMNSDLSIDLPISDLRNR